MSKVLTFTEFSKVILETGDIDPDYIFIREQSKIRRFKDTEVFNWILHKLVIYDSVSELEVMLGLKLIDKVKYGGERRKAKRHASKYLANLKRAFDGVDLKWFFSRNGQLIFDDIKKINGFGPWAAWKFMDLMHCAYGIDVDFNGIDFRRSYEFPLKGLLMVNGLPERIELLNDTNLYEGLISEVKQICDGIKPKQIPHNGNRGINMNEIETLLCKYHSYKHNHYYPGKDLDHLNKRIKESDCII